MGLSAERGRGGRNLPGKDEGTGGTRDSRSLSSQSCTRACAAGETSAGSGQSLASALRLISSSACKEERNAKAQQPTSEARGGKRGAYQLRTGEEVVVFIEALSHVEQKLAVLGRVVEPQLQRATPHQRTIVGDSALRAGGQWVGSTHCKPLAAHQLSSLHKQAVYNVPLFTKPQRAL
jgi:hypothetical protein